MSKLNVAVVGIGFWGRNHIRVLSEIPEVDVRAVCDIDLGRAEVVAERLGLRAYRDMGEMLRGEPEIDAVTLCVWSKSLAKEAVRALKAGKHVFIEKPMASTSAEARGIIDLAEKQGLLVEVGFIERFNPAVRRLKEMIDRGDIGSPVSATVRRVSKWPERIGDIGVIKDTAIHDIDIMRYIFGEDPASVYAKAGRLRHKRFEDYAQIMLAFSGGRTAFIEANWLTPHKVRRLVVTGSEAIISIDYITQELTIETEGHTLTPREEWVEPLKLELRHFVECVIEGRKPLVTGLDGLKALQIAEAVLRSAEEGRVIRLRPKK